MDDLKIQFQMPATLSAMVVSPRTTQATMTKEKRQRLVDAGCAVLSLEDRGVTVIVGPPDLLRWLASTAPLPHDGWCRCDVCTAGEVSGG